MSPIKPFRNIREYIHESNLIEGFDSPEADAALLKAWEYLGEATRLRNGNGRRLPVTHTIICNIHERLVAHQKDKAGIWPGAYRDRSRIRVYIGDREGLAPAQVGAAMDDWLERYNKNEEDPKQLHIDFEHIHPFVDGNGRTGRLLLWYQQQVRGVQPTLIKKSEVADYYEWFK